MYKIFLHQQVVCTHVRSVIITLLEVHYLGNIYVQYVFTYLYDRFASLSVVEVIVAFMLAAGNSKQ